MMETASQSPIMQELMQTLMPLMTTGMMTGFDCKWVQTLLDTAENMVKKFVIDNGFEMMADGIVAAIDFVLTQLGIRKECEAIQATYNNNAMF